MSSRPRVLIVEDELIVARNLQERLHKLGYDVAEIASTGEEAVSSAGKHQPDIVLMDIRLKGDRDGIDAGEEINQRMGIPVVYLTAHTDDNTLVRAKNTNPYGYLLKPIEGRELKATIEMTLMKHSMAKRLHDRERWLSTILSSVGEAVIVINLENEVTYVNSAAEVLIKIRANDTIGRSFTQTIPIMQTDPEDQSEHPLEKLIENGRIKLLPDVLFLQTKDNVRISVEGRISPLTDELGTVTGAVLILKDITERRIAKKELLYQLEFESLITEISSQYISVTSDNMNNVIDETLAKVGKFTLVDRTYIYMADYKNQRMNLAYEWCVPGISPCLKKIEYRPLSEHRWFIEKITQEDAVYIPIISEMPEEALRERNEISASGVQTLLCVSIKQGERLIGMFGFDSVSNERVWSESSIKMIQVVGDLIGAAITRLQAEKELRENQEKFRNIAEMVPEAIFEADEKGYITFVNRRGFEYFGYHPEEFYTGFKVLSLFASQDQEKAQEGLMRILAGEKLGVMEMQVVRKDGSTFPATIHTQAQIRHGKIIGIGGLIVDVSELKKRENEYLKNQKLESIGVLAGGIAHDFNNILTAILGNISLAAMEVDSESELFAILSDAEKASIRARDLTQQLLTFSEGDSPVKKSSSIAHIIKESTEFCLLGSNVRCEFSLPGDLHRVKIDQSQMSQVISNIIINADQAMPTGGRISVSAENIVIENNSTLSLDNGSYIKITIKDKGVGISKSDMDRIFDPFYTTKEDNNGMGLAIAYSIIKKHNGAIDVESQPAIGTTFFIYLPSTTEGKQMGTSQSISHTAGAGRILIMDDEAGVRKLAGRVLKKLGYDVDCVSDGEEAVILYKEAKEKNWPFDLIIMDLTIPGGMGGKDALAVIQQIDPQVKAIVSSGYSNDPVMGNHKAYGFKACVVKPYRPNKLANVIAEVLSGK
ncbi:MAG: response regulator [candidate division Zixibacteria bacterium]|nr:response regulator [candidate division Zixibacteria bacterium]